MQLFFDRSADHLSISPPLSSKAKPVKKPYRKFISPKTVAALISLAAALSPGPKGTAEAARVYRNQVNPQWAIDNSRFW